VYARSHERWKWRAPDLKPGHMHPGISKPHQLLMLQTHGDARDWPGARGRRVAAGRLPARGAIELSLSGAAPWPRPDTWLPASSPPVAATAPRSRPSTVNGEPARKAGGHNFVNAGEVCVAFLTPDGISDYVRSRFDVRCMLAWRGVCALETDGGRGRPLPQHLVLVW
jgi:hypothetical protein